jgi:phytanoyl-CoA hydroxylase
MVLTDEDIWYFKHSGFYRVPECLPADFVDTLNSVTNRQIAEMIEPVVWERNGKRCAEDVRRLSKVLSRDSAYLKAGSHPIILEALEGILGPNIELLTNKHNHIMVRPPGSENVYWHSGEEPYDHTLITALIYLEESTLENGCVRIVPGSHMRPFRRDRRPSEDFLESDLYNRSLPVPMPRGGILLFNDCCFHGSGTNESAGSRRSVTLGYRSHDAHDVAKEDPEKILIKGERIYTGHPHPFR